MNKYLNFPWSQLLNNVRLLGVLKHKSLSRDLRRNEGHPPI